MKKVAFIGLGVMGYPMAGHLQKSGYQVTVYNRTTEKAIQWCNEFSGKYAVTPKAAAASDRPTTQLDNNPSIARDHPEQIEKANQRCRVPPPRLRLIRTTVQSLYTGSEPPAFNMLSDPGEAQFNFRDCCEQRALPLTQSFFAG
jgi:UDP-N-acetylmuramoylalanine-D-glutamate ligase